MLDIPSIYARVTPKFWKQRKLIRSQRAVITPTSEQIVADDFKNADIQQVQPKGDDSLSKVGPDEISAQMFIVNCMEASGRCRNASSWYFWLSIITRMIGSALSACAGTIANEVKWQVGVTAGCLGAIFIVLDLLFKWSNLSEKYARTAHDFRSLSLSGDPSRFKRFQELKIIAESAVLESDLD